MDLVKEKIKEFSEYIEGEVYVDDTMRTIYATDASAYKEMPLAVILPKNEKDIKKILAFVRKNNLSVIPRTAGTSLAGQVVGSGIVVDVSKHFTNIKNINADKKTVSVEPGVILDELNQELAKYGLFFGPETSTSSRCMIGGMVGNNSCGAHSLIYGSTRDHTISVKGFLSTGEEVEFKELTKAELEEKLKLDSKEGQIYRHLQSLLSDKEFQQEIEKQYPDASIKRRNTGYALDLLKDSFPVSDSSKPLNLSNLIAGSEGTLMFITEITLSLIPVPPKEKALVCTHFNTLDEALEGNLIALKHNPGSIELMDKTIMDCTKENIEHRKNRFWIKGDPEAVLIIEFARDSKEEIKSIVSNMITDFKESKSGYHFPVLFDDDIRKVWSLRKAGLGLLANIPGDKKAVPVIEDTAINPKVLPAYIKDFEAVLKKHELSCVYYAHIATGELHLRPVLDLKKEKDTAMFRTIAYEIAKLVKKYNGSLSGEHGDGRLRGEFIPYMLGDKIYNSFKELKKIWDPENIFNPGKITDTPSMNTFLRYSPGEVTPEIDTIFDFSKEAGFIRAIEKCNGSGDCRKTEKTGGVMCPSYMATKDEDKTTRARANALREMLKNPGGKDIFNNKEIYKILDLCLSCKGCKSECPSSVDMAKLKAEFLQHYYDANGVPMRSKLIANIAQVNKLGAIVPGITNFFMKNAFTSKIMKQVLGFAPARSIPLLYKFTLRSWLKGYKPNIQMSDEKAVYLFADEFTDYNDTEIGVKAVKLLNKLGYKVLLPKHYLSGRTYLSKGLIRKAKVYANKNVDALKDIVSSDKPLLGIEPSGILSFRDEYPELVDTHLIKSAKVLAESCLMIDEFLAAEMAAGKIDQNLFKEDVVNIKLHGHCHQKSLASTKPTKEVLSFPKNYVVDEIPSGCCGMAGAFGYEKEHYELSMKVGELVLFPEVRKQKSEVVIAAPGTSCRHQIKDGTGRTAYHPLEILYDALK